VDYLCANFGIPRPLCSRLRPDVRDRQTDVRQHYRFMLPPIRGVGIIMENKSVAMLSAILVLKKWCNKYWNNCSTATITSCARGDTTCLRPCKLTISSYLFARCHLFQHVGYVTHQQQVDLWPFYLESGVRVTCDVGFLCANFSLPRLLCSRVRPDVRDRQTDVRETYVRLTSDKNIA